MPLSDTNPIWHRFIMHCFYTTYDKIGKANDNTCPTTPELVCWLIVEERIDRWKNKGRDASET
jgi:hypothetical protein